MEALYPGPGWHPTQIVINSYLHSIGMSNRNVLSVVKCQIQTFLSPGVREARACSWGCGSAGASRKDD